MSVGHPPGTMGHVTSWHHGHLALTFSFHWTPGEDAGFHHPGGVRRCDTGTPLVFPYGTFPGLPCACVINAWKLWLQKSEGNAEGLGETFFRFSGRSIPYQNWCFQAIGVNKIPQIGSWNPNFRVFFMKKNWVATISFHETLFKVEFLRSSFFQEFWRMLEKKSSVENPLPNQKGFHVMCICNYIYIYIYIYISTGILRNCYCIMLYNMFACLFCFPVIKIFTQPFTAFFHCIVSLLSVATNAMQSSDDSHPCSPIVGETAKCE